MNIITNDATNKCVTFKFGLGVMGESGKSVFGDGVVAVNYNRASSTAAKYTAQNYDVANKVWIVTTDNDATYRGCSIVELDLIKDNWAVSTAATTVLTDAKAVAATILGYLSPYKI